MLRILTDTSTWLMVELVATVILILMNLLIPLLMSFSRYRTIANFYFSSVALSSSLLNCLYMYYLVQTFQTKTLSENNCRAIYYLQTSCIVVLGKKSNEKSKENSFSFSVHDHCHARQFCFMFISDGRCKITGSDLFSMSWCLFASFFSSILLLCGSLYLVIIVHGNNSSTLFIGFE